MASHAAKKKPPQDVVEFFDVEQKSDPWFELRRGVPTASKFSVIMAEGKDGAEAKTREDYMERLVGELISGQVAESFRNEAMDRGNRMELDWLAGQVSRLGKQYGVPTPINDTIYAALKLYRMGKS